MPPRSTAPQSPAIGAALDRSHHRFPSAILRAAEWLGAEGHGCISRDQKYEKPGPHNVRAGRTGRAHQCHREGRPPSHQTHRLWLTPGTLGSHLSDRTPRAFAVHVGLSDGERRGDQQRADTQQEQERPTSNQEPAPLPARPMPATIKPNTMPKSGRRMTSGRSS